MANTRSRLNRRIFVTGAAASALAPITSRARTSKDADVIVIGGGLSGLFAAMQLNEFGYRVIVLEGSSRVGGRLWTLDELPGAPEAGGQQVGQTYARIRYAAEKTGVKIIDDETQERPQRTMAFGDTLINPVDWASSDFNPFPEPFRSATPDSVLFASAAPENPFDWPGAWRDAGAPDIDMSASDFLRNKGFNEDALALINATLNANALETYSMVNVWRTLQLFSLDRSLGPSGDIAGGSQRLPEAMAALLGDAVRVNAPVQAIAQRKDGVEIRTNDTSLRADFGVVALPFPTVAKLRFEPALTGAMADAVNGIPYTQILQLHLLPGTRFWESDGAPAMMWTDGPLERIFVTRDSDTNEIVGLNAWINGDHARRLAKESDEALERLARAELKRLRPASNGDIKLRKAIRWTKSGSYAGGAYMHWAPGQAKRWAEKITMPSGRIYFAGEHLSHLHTGMEGAMEAGDRAAREIMAASNR